MKIAKLIFGLVAAVGIVSLGWRSSPDAFEQWLIAGIMTLTGLSMAISDVREFYDTND